MNAPPSRAAIAGHELERFPGATRVRVETPDLNGGLRGKYVALERLRNGGVIALPEVYLSLDVLDRVFESSISAEADGFGDMVIAPDWTSARPMPGEPGVIAVVADGLTSTGQRHSLHPRSALRNVVERAASSGFSATFGVEYEFSLFRQREPRDSRPFPGLSDLGLMSRSTQGYSLTRWSSLREFATDLDAASREYGVVIESMHTETGSFHVEAALAPVPPLEAADMATRFKSLVKEVGRRHGLIASFMAKVDMEQQGLSGHQGQVRWGGVRG